MKALLLHTAALLTVVTVARADFNPIALTPDSFTQDVIIEKTATPPAQAQVTANMDAGTNIAGTVGGTGGNHGAFYEIGFGTTAGSGLPLHGSVFNAVSNANHTFQMPPDYTVPNAIFVGGAGSVSPQVQTGVLTLPTPASYTHLSLLAAAGGGATYIQYTVNYADANTDQQTIVITDWQTTNNASTANTAWTENGWFRGTDGTYQNVNTTPQTTRLFYYDLPLSYPASQVSSVQIDFVSGGRVAVFAMSGSTDGGTTFKPIAVTGYNYDMIIEAPLAKMVTATVDNGLLIPTNTSITISRGDNNVLFEQGFNLISASTTPIPRAQNGLPHPGAIFNALSNSAHAFQMPPTYTGPNAILVNTQSQSGTLTLNSATTLNALSILSTAGNGPVNVALTINHQDGSSEITNFLCPDWFGSLTTNLNLAYQAAGRVPTGRLNVINNGGATNGTLLWYNDIQLLNPSSPVTSVQFNYTTGTGKAVIFALSGSTDSVNFSPLAVSGFNQDMIVEAGAITNMDLRAFSTASMDGGTNNNANIWYEQGWNSLAPDSGLPTAGSTLTSTNLSDHHYQMPSDYAAKNAVYCDSNNPIASISFANPTNFSAVSFLSANGAGGIQIQVILNHAGAPSETNTFNSKDWFSGTPAAYTTDGRCSSDNHSANNWVPATASNPRLYEAQFALADTVHNVTGATLIWTTNNGTGGVSGANSRFVVLAVSGTTGATAPVISSIVPQTFAGYEGTNFTLAASAGGNPAPTYQWQAGASGSGVFTNLNDDGVVTGAHTATLTFTGARLQDTADYQLVAANAVGTVTSSTATVRILSAIPNVLAVGDPITQFGGTSAGGQDVTRAIDHVVGTNKYLNFGVNGGVPFAGPVGLIVTPTMGSTVVSAMRIYPGNDHEERDPADYILEGSNDGGSTWNQIASGALALPSTRTATAPLNPLAQLSQEIHFPNSTAFTSYRWTVNNVKTNDVANSMSVGEIELLGTLNATPPYFTVQPAAAVTNFVGGSPVFLATALGPTPIAYQWRRDGANIPGATGTSFSLANVQLSDSGHTYTCVASNQYGATPSSGSLLTVIAPPTNSYPAAVLADHPIAYWRLDEGPDNGVGNDGVIGFDYMGGHNGTYGKTTLGVAGYDPAIDTNSAAQFAGTTGSYLGGMAGIDFSATNGTSASFTVEAWVLSGLAGVQAGDDGIITKGNGGAEQFNLDTGGANPAHNFRFFVRDAAGATHGAVATNAPDQNWHHVVGVCDGTNGHVYIYIDGHQNGTIGNLGAVGILSSAIPVSVGARKQSVTSDYNLAFNGALDEVAIYNYALTPAQIAKHFLSLQPAPVLTVQSLDASNVSVTWPAVNGYVLQSTVDLNNGSAGWQDVPSAGAGQATVPITTAQQFFRLIYR